MPRTYGIDDIPLVLTDRDINTSINSWMFHGDSTMVNGVLRLQFFRTRAGCAFRNSGTEQSNVRIISASVIVEHFM
ncbi:MAG: hypothetical protein IPJ66_10865 [Bacteroidetes bacterium]|nr:hypothetical protein [Bacteroidota bacterium]